MRRSSEHACGPQGEEQDDMTNIKRILVPTDFSKQSDKALQYAMDLGQALNAQLYLLHVPGKSGENFEADFPFGQFESPIRERFERLASPPQGQQMRTEFAVRIGTPPDAIMRYVGDREIDLIVMGTHGRSGVAHALMGSVAEEVVRQSPCPVLVVRRA
jgi:nucleotide-binding universal stress UspA family protein